MSLFLGVIGVILAQGMMGFNPGTWQFWAIAGYGLICFLAGKYFEVRT